MPSVFAGSSTILEHLLPTGTLTDYYANALGLRQSSSWLARAVSQLAHRYPRANILEVGAGTGGATKSILRRLGSDFASYTFTDVSTGFFEQAEATFASWRGRMIFRALDADRDPIAQGFTPGSYDVVVASFVIHATSKLEQTMRYMRSLLRPGGYVVLGESTNQNWTRDGFVFGTLPGWWAGIPEGRDLSPCVSAEPWDEVLRNTGFSGIDAITPETFNNTYATGVFVSQAVNDHVSFLREPLSADLPRRLIPRQQSVMQDLVIIGGATLRTSRLAMELKGILRGYAEKINMYKSLVDVAFDSIGPDSAVVSLTELDKPIFDDITSGDFEALKQLVTSEKTLLWLTKDRRFSSPFSNMSVGFLRNAVCENRELRLQCLDFEENPKIEARVVAEALLRLVHASCHVQPEVLWSVEPEVIVDAAGRQLIPRFEPMTDANDRYNSARRIVTREVRPLETAVTIEADPRGKHEIHEIATVLESSSQDDDTVELHASHAVLSPIKTPLGARYLALGTTESNSGHNILALTTSLASVQRVSQIRNYVMAARKGRSSRGAQ